MAHPLHGGAGEHSSPLTPTIEKYLEAIYHLMNEDKPVIGARLAERLSVSAPTVTNTLKRMEQLDLLKLNERREVVLSEYGQAMALSIARRHYISERFLVDLLGMPWHRAHTEAHRLEHALSPEVERRLSALLGNPSTCPHGSPIPGGGQAREPRGRPLNQVAKGATVTIERITEQGEDDERLLEFFWTHRLMPGTDLLVRERAPYLGTMTVAIGAREVVMGLETAAQVLVLER